MRGGTWGYGKLGVIGKNGVIAAILGILRGGVAE